MTAPAHAQIDLLSMYIPTLTFTGRTSWRMQRGPKYLLRRAWHLLEWVAAETPSSYGEFVARRLCYIAVFIKSHSAAVAPAGAAGAGASGGARCGKPSLDATAVEICDEIIKAFVLFDSPTAIRCAISFFHAALYPAHSQAALRAEIARQEAEAAARLQAEGIAGGGRPPLAPPLASPWAHARGAQPAAPSPAFLTGGFRPVSADAAGASKSAYGGAGDASPPDNDDDAEESARDIDEVGAERSYRGPTCSSAFFEGLKISGPLVTSHNMSNCRPIGLIENEALVAGVERLAPPLLSREDTLERSPQSSIESLFKAALPDGRARAMAVAHVTQDLHRSLATRSKNFLLWVCSRRLRASARAELQRERVERDGVYFTPDIGDQLVGEPHPRTTVVF